MQSYPCFVCFKCDAKAHAHADDQRTTISVYFRKGDLKSIIRKRKKKKKKLDLSQGQDSCHRDRTPSPTERIEDIVFGE